MSSTSKVQSCVATTVALRGSPVSKASSPKKCPAPRRSESVCSCTSYSPSTTKYMQSPGSPRRHLGNQRSSDVVEKRHLGDELPGAQKLPPAELLGIAVDDDAGPQRKDQDAADHDDAGKRPSGDRMRHDIAIAGRRHRHDPPPQRHRD